MLGGRKVRSNKGKKRGAYGPRSGKTRSGRRFRGVSPVRRSSRKVRSNKGKKRGPRSGKTRSGRKFRGGSCGENRAHKGQSGGGAHEEKNNHHKGGNSFGSQTPTQSR